ncbi:MAG: alanine--tRNA ligase [Planctomycetota bacterium]|nr:alanine--tRNA ligase [Planctomycetota bacterium]
MSELPPSFPSSQAVRQSFLDFFAAQDHRVVPSSPVFPQDDPTLLFMNAGMNQFKDVFLGTGTRDYSRAVDSQKCIRVQGKHNDLEEVGVDTYHHTFFEMLGNWSFGDYFKKEAIIWHWDLLTKVWKLPKERLWVTVFAGDEGDGLEVDEEAEKLWLKLTDVDPTHILRCGKKDTFWEMGETGPCGPCSEIHIDRGGPDDDPADGANPDIGVNADNERFIELCNLVFMQFNRLDDGSLRPLPAGCIDTGMGFERVLSVLQGKSSNYDTDLFTPIFDELSQIAGHEYGTDEKKDIAFRVCADHVRAVTSALSDGALPSNEGRGYVLRRLIRRASRYGLQTLGLEEPFLYRLIAPVIGVLGDAFPEMKARREHVELIMRSEEESFRRTLQRGIVQFDKLTNGLKSGDTLEGVAAYELYATYGFPQDLVELMASERDLSLDTSGWEKAKKAHSEVSKSEGRFKQLLSAEQVSDLKPTVSTYADCGSTRLRLDTKLSATFPDDGKGERWILESSPFYAEGGGQVGDTGRLLDTEGNPVFDVTDTKRIGDIVVHMGKPLQSVQVGQGLIAEVDGERRARTQANHTATHLLHKALQEVLGDHVTQQGSHVGPERLRFDFSQPKGLTPEQLAQVESKVNAQILRNQPVYTTLESFDGAKARGVMALFGEKYGDEVRVVDVGGWSLELCGGTHVSSGGDIGPFVIVTERAIQAGVRRIEALTHEGALEHIATVRGLLADTARNLKVKEEELPERVSTLVKDLKKAKKAGSQKASGDVGAVFEAIKTKLAERAGVPSGIFDLPEMDGDGLRALGERVGSLGPDLALVLLGRAGDKVPFLVLSRGQALEKGLKAGVVAKAMAKVLGGGGGGRPESAQGQGMKADAAPEALAAAEEVLAASLS